MPYGEIIDPPDCNGEGVGPGNGNGIGMRVGRRDGLFVGDLVLGAIVVGALVMTSGYNDGDGVRKFGISVCGDGDGKTVDSVVCVAVGTSVCGDSDGEAVGTIRPVASNVPTERVTFLNVSESSAFK